MMLQQKTTVIDLKWLLSYGDYLLSPIRRSIANEQRTNSVFANTRFHSKASIQNLCQSIQRQLRSQIILVFRSISDDGFCPTGLSRKLKRYRNLPKSFAHKTLSLRLSWKSFSQQLSQLKRKKRLAYISRFCTGSYFQSKATLCQRRLWHYIRKYRLCFGRNRDRLVPVAVSLGPASQSQKCSEVAYTNRPERLNTYIRTHYKRCCTRNDSLSNNTSGGFCHICHGQRLHRFCNIIQFYKEQLLLHYQSQKECSLLSQVFSSYRQEYWLTKRPDNKTDWSEDFKTLPDTTETNHFSRRRTGSNFRVSDQQLSVGRIDNLSTLQTSLADRTVLQMDQATLENKVFFRYFNQCRQDPSLDSDQCLCACSNNQKETETGAFVTRNTPNYKYPTFRENPAKTSTYGKLLYF